MKTQLKHFVEAFLIIRQMPDSPAKVAAIVDFFRTLHDFDFGQDLQKLILTDDGSKYTFVFIGGQGIHIHLQAIIEDDTQTLQALKSVFPKD